MFLPFQKGLEIPSDMGNPYIWVPSPSFSTTEEAKNVRQSIFQLLLLLGYDHMLSNHFYPLQTLKLMDKEANRIGNSSMYRQCYIYVLGIAVAIAPSSKCSVQHWWCWLCNSCLVTAITISLQGQFWHFIWDINLDPNLGSLAVMENYNIS